MNDYDHGDFGVELLFGEGLIRNFIKSTKYDEIIMRAIKNHNKMNIENNLYANVLLHCKIIRDADKIDIFRIKISEPVSSIVPSTEEHIINDYISNNVYEDIMTNKIVLNSRRVTMLDMFVNTIGFIYDLNFTATLKILKEKSYIKKLLYRFSYQNNQTKERIDTIYNHAINYIEEQIKNS